MAGNIQNVSFVNPMDPAASAALQVQQQQLQRNQAIADALREKAFSTPQVANGSRESWTQGLAMLGQALASKHLQTKNNAQSVDLAKQQGTMMAGMFGFKQPSPQAAATGAALPGAQQPAPQPAPQATPPAQVPNPTYGSGGVDDNGQQSPTTPAPPTDQVSNVPQPQPSPQPTPQGGPPPQGGPAPQGMGDPSQIPPAAPQGPTPPPVPQPAPQQGNGPMNLTHDPMQDYSMYAMNQDAYTTALIAAHAPTDFAKQLQQAGVQPGTALYQQIMQANIAKQNNIPLVSGRPGAPMYRQDGSIAAVSPQNIEGANPDVQNGHFTGAYTPAPGAAGVIRNVASAKAFGGAAGSMTNVVGPDGAMHAIPTQTALTTPGGVQTGLVPGAGEFAGGLGHAGAQYFSDLQTKAQPINNQVYGLKQIEALASSPTVFGPGSDAAVKTAGVLNQVGQAFGIPGSFNNVNVTSQQEMNKWAGQVAAQAAGAMGLNGSDARFNIALESNPSGHMTNSALKTMVPQIIGLAQGVAGQAQAGAKFAQANPGPNAQGQFQSMWNQNYDPRIYTWLAQGPAAVRQNMAALKKSNSADYNALAHKAKWLGDYGALPQ